MINYDSSFIYDDSLLTYDGTQTVQVTGTASLGAASSSATTVVKKVAQAEALFGALNALAQSSTPTPQQYSSGKAYYQPKKKFDNKLISPKPIIIDLEPEPLNSLFKTIFATTQSDLQGMTIKAKSRIDFSIMEDEAELLLIL